MSLPVPPTIVSLPVPPTIVSLPSPPESEFAPELPVSRLASALPVPLIAADPDSVRFSTLAPSVKVTELVTRSVPPPAASVTVSPTLSTT
ncbi:hypothetical protein C2U72_21905 [Prosthecomicrobium hirschii]|nr:hypothetical protein C2U72_21905 [Prosthecomicrobium hirschii]